MSSACPHYPWLCNFLWSYPMSPHNPFHLKLLHFLFIVFLFCFFWLSAWRDCYNWPISWKPHRTTKLSRIMLMARKLVYQWMNQFCHICHQVLTFLFPFLSYNYTREQQHLPPPAFVFFSLSPAFKILLSWMEHYAKTPQNLYEYCTSNVPHKKRMLLISLTFMPKCAKGDNNRQLQPKLRCVALG